MKCVHFVFLNYMQKLTISTTKLNNGIRAGGSINDQNGRSEKNSISTLIDYLNLTGFACEEGVRMVYSKSMN